MKKLLLSLLLFGISVCGFPQTVGFYSGGAAYTNIYYAPYGWEIGNTTWTVTDIYRIADSLFITVNDTAIYRITGDSSLAFTDYQQVNAPGSVLSAPYGIAVYTDTNKVQSWTADTDTLDINADGWKFEIKPFDYGIEYDTVWAAYTNKPSSTDSVIQRGMVYSLDSLGVWDKAEVIDVFASHSNTASEALKNWHNPGTFDATLINAPGWAQYSGFTGDTAGVNDKLVNLNFNPATDGTLVSQNSFCMIMGIATDEDKELTDAGGNDGGDYIMIQSRIWGGFWTTCNDISISTVPVNLNSIKHLAISRGVATNYDKYINLAKTNVVVASNGTVNVDLYTCGYNNNGTGIANTRQVRYLFIFSYLTETEVDGVIIIMEHYLDHYAKGLY